MIRIEEHDGALSESEQAVVCAGFREHSEEQRAPAIIRKQLKWLGCDEDGELRAALTAEVVWDWMYIDELWVGRELRGAGVGARLMESAEEWASSAGLQGIWLWTQDWQAAGFYERLGYREFCRFPNFPTGFERIGLRKVIGPVSD